MTDHIDRLQLSPEFVQSHRLTALADKQAGAGAYSLHIDVAIELLTKLEKLLREDAGQGGVCPVPNTQEQNIAFRKEWDRRVEEGWARNGKPS